MTIDELLAEALSCSKSKGFCDKPLNVGEQLMMIVGEASEAMEDYRSHEIPDGLRDLGFALKDLVFWSDSGDGPYGIQRSFAEIEEDVADFEKRWKHDMDTIPTTLTKEQLVVRKSELLSEVRALHKPCGFPSELADVVIRVATLAARMDIDLNTAITEKLLYNRTRSYLHGGKKV